MASQPVCEEVFPELEKNGILLTAVLNRQGPARVWRGIDHKNRDVVVRFVKLAEGASGLHLLRRLADLRTLRHPGIVPVREVIALPDNWAAVLSNYVTGVDLGVMIAVRGKMSPGEQATLLDSIGSAVAYLHEHGIIHGDIAPGNVMVTQAGLPCLVDLIGSVEETGTEGYAAPEQLAGGPATTAADVYAVARLIESAAGEVIPLFKDALSSQPEQRPTARELAACAPELGQKIPLSFPDGAELATGTLRAAAVEATRVVPKRKKLKATSRRKQQGGLKKQGVRRNWLAGVALTTALAGAGVFGTQLFEPASAQFNTTTSAIPSEVAASRMVTSESVDLAVVASLCGQRDTALNHNSMDELAKTTVAGSAARHNDEELLERLKDSGEQVNGLHTTVFSVQETAVEKEYLKRYPNARAARVTLRQEESQRISVTQGSQRTVPAQVKRSVTLVLIPDPWRVLDVKK